jgi:hypothetical protein
VPWLSLLAVAAGLVVGLRLSSPRIAQIVAAEPIVAAAPATDQLHAPLTADVQRYRELITTLASEKMEGRGPGTKGIELSRDFIAACFTEAGLQPLFRPAAKPTDNAAQLGYLQPFETRVGTKLKEARLALAAPAERAQQFRIDRDFTVMGFSAPKTVEGPAVFVGYGVKNDRHKYDSYASDGQPAPRDAFKGKIVICWRYEPMNADGQSTWGEKGSWVSAQLNAKASLAASHGAVALLFVNPPSHAKEGLKSTATSAGPPASLPVVQITPDVLKTLFDAAGRAMSDAQLAEMQREADKGKTGPIHLEGVTLSVAVKMEAKNETLHNVAAVLPGAGALADQYVVVGAHYDHLGQSGDGPKRIYYGADDNASGTAAVILLAERFGKLAQQKTLLPPDRRSLVFMAFSGEERGLLGSRHFVNRLEDASLKAEQITAMINLDMVGRMRENRATAGGVASADRWGKILDAALENSGLVVQRAPSGFGPSDHSSFYRAKVPVLYFHTGIHGDIHSPRDTVEKINFEGAVKIVNVVEAVLRQLWSDPDRLAYVAPMPGQEPLGAMRPGGAYLGIIPQLGGEDGQGVGITELLPDGPAAKAGLQAGDVITAFAEKPLASLADLFRELAGRKPGDRVKLTVRRGEETVPVEVTLGKR